MDNALAAPKMVPMRGHQRIVFSVHVKCLPGARMSLMISDGTLHASAQHLLENFMRLRSQPRNPHPTGP